MLAGAQVHGQDSDFDRGPDLRVRTGTVSVRANFTEADVDRGYNGVVTQRYLYDSRASFTGP